MHATKRFCELHLSPDERNKTALPVSRTGRRRASACRWRAKTVHTGLQRAGRVGVDPCSMLFCALGGVTRDCLRKRAGPYRYLTSSQLPHYLPMSAAVVNLRSVDAWLMSLSHDFVH